jgi:hypothetical protein
MPGFNYYATFDESIAILQAICDRGYTVVAYPELFDEPKAPLFTAISDELRELLRIAPAFFLAGKFSRFPIQYRKLPTGPAAGKYRIDFLSEGPLLQALLARANIVDGSLTLLPGDVIYQAKYRNPETDVWVKAGREVKTAHREVVSIIQARCVPYQANAEVFITPGALELLKSGQAKMSHAPVA